MNNQEHLNVINTTVKNELCIGCGVCAGVCPSKTLKMRWHECGDLIVHKEGECPPKCDLCLKVCPFSDQTSDEDTIAEKRFGAVPGIEHNKSVGYYLSSYVGHSLLAEHRPRGSSGGMATWMLETLLKTGLVDSVACVGHAHSRDRLFCYHILEDIVKVREAAGSHYYPVDMADIIKVLQSSESSNKRYAVVGLPCRLKSLRLAMSHSPRLRQRLVFLVGLVCGHLPNLYYTEYLARLSGIAPGELATADYRLKQGIRAGNYYFQGRKHNGTLGRQVPFLGQVSKAWGEGYFQYNACNYCDDVFAEVADAVFMDAWLPEYESNPKGHSLVVVRHPELDELLRKGIEERTCHLESIPIDEVIASQKALVHRKKVQIGAHLHLARKRGEWVPNKRIQASRETYSKNVRTITAHYGVQRKSKELWPRLREKSLWRFHLHMLKEEYPLLVSFWWNRLCRVVARLWLALRPLTLFFRRRLAGGQRSRL